jgi:hypothetical protein
LFNYFAPRKETARRLPMEKERTWISNQIIALELSSATQKKKVDELELRLAWYRELEEELLRLQKQKVFG